MIELIVKKEDREINRYFLPQGITTLGRAEDNAIILDDSCVSRRHARIKVEGARILIEDLGSGNGTFYADARIEQRDLGDGDEVVIEPFKLILHTEKPDARRADSTRPVPSSRPPPSTRLDEAPPRPAREPGGSAAGGVRLEVVKGSGGPYLLPEDGPIVLGRSDEATLTLKDASASRKHAQVEKTSRGWILTDLGSANGTYMNGASVKEVPLADGDILLIGNTELRFVDPSAVAAPPPASTRPVPAGRPVGNSEFESELPPPRITEDMGVAAGMEMGGSFGTELGGEDAYESDAGGNGYHGGGAMPSMPVVGGTDVGGPPPSAFGLEATGEGPAMAPGPGGTMTGDFPEFADGGYAPDPYGADGGYGTDGGYGGDAGYGMELGDGALFPGGERPPDSLVGKFIFAFKTNPRVRIFTILGGLAFFLILVVKAGSDGKGSATGAVGYVEQLDKQQEITLRTMESDFNEANAAAKKGDVQNLHSALERYSRVVTFAGNDTMRNVLQAEKFGREATKSIYAIHEFLVVSRLGDVTRSGEKRDAATEALIKQKRAEGASNLARARRTKSIRYYQIAINAFGVVLDKDPGADDVRKDLSEARSEMNVLIAKNNAENLEELRLRLAREMQRGRAQAAKRTARGYQASITVFEGVIDKDPSGRTEFPGQAKAEIDAAKKRLRSLARPLRDQGKAAVGKQDWLRARAAYRQAVSTDPFDPTLQDELSAVQTECLLNARRQISEGKAYMGAFNFDEAMKSLSLALKYADRPADKEHQQTMDLIKQIKRANER